MVATAAVFGSRLLGLIREMVMAFFFGAGPVLDAFIAAFRIPNLLRDLFSEGALSNAFVTDFSKKLAGKGDQDAYELADRVHGFVWVLMVLIVLLGILFSPALVHVVASGFEGEKFDLTVKLNRILFPFILFVSLAALSMGMLNSKGRYALPQSASTFFNFTSIIFGLGFATYFEPQFMCTMFAKLMGKGASLETNFEQWGHAMEGMAWGTLLGGLGQWLIQVPALWNLGYRFKPRFNFFHKDLRHVLGLTFAAIIGGAAVQVNVLVNTNFASYLTDGSISWLAFAFRLMQFPLGVFGVAVALATTPAISKMVAQNQMGEIKQTMRDSLGLAFFLCIPSMLGLFVLAQPIIALIYQYGRFSPEDTRQAAFALQAYTCGLIPYALIKIYQPIYLAYNDAKTPMIISLISIVINFVVNWFLVFKLNFDHWGLALGTSIVAIWNGGMLVFLFRKKMKDIWSKDIVIDLAKMIIVGTISVLCGYALNRFMGGILTSGSFIDRVMLFFPALFFVMILYFVLSHVFKIPESHLALTWLKGRLKR